MTTLHTPELLLRLVCEDLRMRKLIYGLEDLGLDAEPYFPTLSTLLFSLLEFPPGQDDLYDIYEQLCQPVRHIRPDENDGELKALAATIAARLQEYRQNTTPS